MVAVITHEVNAWKVELTATRGALGDVEDTRMLGVGEVLDLF